MLENIFRRLNAIKPILGRWCLNDKSKNNWKIDMANVDHCGTCSYKPPHEVSKLKDLETPQSPPKKAVSVIV
jgi:hypothetical protein